MSKILHVIVKILLLVRQRFTCQLYCLDTLLDIWHFFLDIRHRGPHGLSLRLHGLLETVRGVFSVLNVSAGGADRSIALHAIES